MVYPENKAAADHFENLRSQYAEGVQRVKGKYLFIFRILINCLMKSRCVRDTKNVMNNFPISRLM